MSSMFSLIKKQYKIFQAVVVMDIIDVMNNFLRVQIPTNTLFHNQSVFSNITTVVMKWMGGIIDIYIATRFIFPTLPAITFFAPRRTKMKLFGNPTKMFSVLFRKLSTRKRQGYFASHLQGPGPSLGRGNITLLKKSIWRGYSTPKCLTYLSSYPERTFFPKKAFFYKLALGISFNHSLIHYSRFRQLGQG